MGSGRGGLHHGTWGSHEGEELRARVLEAFAQVGDAVAGDAAADLAETLVRIASGESPEEAIPEPGEIAFDLALDALSPFVPGGGRVTRELGAAARRKTPSMGYYSALERGIASDYDIENNAKYANELYRITEAGNFGEAGLDKHTRRIYSSDPVADSIELFERLGRGASDDFNDAPEGMTKRWLKGGTCIVHRSFTSTPDSPAVEISFSTSSKVRDQKVHFFEEKTW